MTAPRVPSPAEDDRNLRAAEIALGLAEDAERNRMLRDDPSLERDVARWQHDLAALADELAPAPPSPQAWASLRDAVASEAAARPAPLASGFRAMFDSLLLWRSLAGSGFAAAAVALLLLVRAPGVEPVQPPMTTRALLVSPLLPRDGAPLYVMTYDAERATILVVPAATRAAADRMPQLWLVAKGAQDPIAIGALDPERPMALKLDASAARLIDADADLVITLEPAGAPVGPAAQGPVVAHGRFTAL